MLPTLGFFHSFDCPFYKGGAGQCSRPYCHYKHAKKDPDAPPEPTEDALGTLVGLSDLAENDSTNDASLSEAHKSRTAMYKATVDAAPTYKPTPISVLKSSHIPIPYTPSIPSRTPVVKKSKPKEEYVPHSIGGARTYYPPYCPTSTNAVDQLRNPLYEIYGPEGAQFSPNDVEPVETGYSYAPPKNASYAPNASSSPDKNEYVPMPVSYSPKNPQFSPPDSQLSDDDDNVDLAVETAAQTNGDCGTFGETNILDLDLSELDDLEFEYEDSEPEQDDSMKGSGTKRKGEELEDGDSISSQENSHPKKSSVSRKDSSKPSSSSKHSSHGSSRSSGEKRRSSSSSSSDAKRLKSSHQSSSGDDSKENGHSEEKKSSNKSSSSHSSHTKKSSSSSSSSKGSGSLKPSSKSSSSSSVDGKKKSHSSSSDNKSKTESSSSSSKSKTESSSSSSKSKSESSSTSSKSKTESSSSSSKSKLESSSSKSKTDSSSSSKSKDKGKDKESDKSKKKEKSKDQDSHKHKDRNKEKDKLKERSTDKEKSSNRSSESKNKHLHTLDVERLEEEIRQMEAELDASLEDEDTIEQQCFEMFSEYSESLTHNTQASTSKTEDQRVTVNEEPVAVVSSKKRIAHQAPHKSMEPPTKPATTLAKKCSPYQVMRDRWEMLKKKKEEAEALHLKSSLAVAPQNVPRLTPPAPYSSTNNTPASLPGSTLPKKKIASVPNVAMLLKPRVAHGSAKTSSEAQTGTPPSRFYNQEKQRVDEYGRLVKVRVAHTPNMESPVMKKPIVNPSDCRKFKVPTRQANVNKLYQAYIDAGFGEQSHDMALESERSSTQGTESLGVYSHRIIQILKDLRACAESSQNGPKLDGLSGVPNRVVSHHAMLAGKLGSKVSWSIQTNKKTCETKVSSQSLYEKLEPYILTKEVMEENGYPMPSNEKGVANIKPSRYRVIQQPSDPRQRICVRCLKPYAVNKHGIQEKDEECFYHWGRKLTFRRYRDAETKYTCCDGTGGQGCSVASYHVYEPNNERNVGYMATLSKPWMDSDPGVYALDCEMCYTTAGTELTRVTVIKEDLSTVYETLVKPSNKILDHNTRFSGITEEDLKGVRTTILQVQATLLGMFCDKTILVGHSLESDLKALKLIHPTVVDTSIVFPHKMGPPQKRALRNLAAEYLKKIIQNDVGGHDSKEDAVAALELMLWKIKEDEKTR